MPTDKAEKWKTFEWAGMKMDYLPWKFVPLTSKIAIILGFGIATIAGIIMLLD